MTEISIGDGVLAVVRVDLPPESADFYKLAGVEFLYRSVVLNITSVEGGSVSASGDLDTALGEAVLEARAVNSEDSIILSDLRMHTSDGRELSVAGASDRRVTARSRLDDSLVAVCGHRGGYGNPKQYSNLVPLESQVEYRGGHLSVMVYTATLAAWADEDDTFRHVWQGERREFAGDSNLACTWQAKKVLPPE